MLGTVNDGTAGQARENQMAFGTWKMRGGRTDVAGARNTGDAIAGGGSSAALATPTVGAGTRALHRQRGHPLSGHSSPASPCSVASKQPSGATSANTSALCNAKTANQRASKSRTGATIPCPPRRITAVDPLEHAASLKIL